jgi:hypothetical protein
MNYILRLRFDRLTLLIIVVAVGAGSSVARSGSSPSAAAQQSCVDRWNWMHYGGWFVGSAEVRWAPTRVRTNPCRIEIAYLVTAGGGRGLAPYFPCVVNRFGAFVCAAHAYGAANGSRLSRSNATFFPKRNGSMRLDRPPTQHPLTAKPSWVRRYEVDHGFIVPFDRRGPACRPDALGREAPPVLHVAGRPAVAVPLGLWRHELRADDPGAAGRGACVSDAARLPTVRPRRLPPPVGGAARTMPAGSGSGCRHRACRPRPGRVSSRLPSV